ncbi:MazG-like family protein [Streptomyces buecherae]|uniref:MazG-like family protein n=1 Tax=Streptomyces buecherae TaxID=2763006 RepID=UPI0020B8C755|nr:MazG-like family protein [Streptomyces buecherae]
MSERLTADQIRADQLDALHERAARAARPAHGAAGAADAGPADGALWEAARAAVAWLDAANATRDRAEETALRLLKLTEETGEVMNAYTGLTGHNPRKGVTHERADVAAELCDVILTAAVVLHEFSDDPAGTLDAHVRGVTERMRAAADERP